MDPINYFTNFRFNPKTLKIEGYTKSDILKIRECIKSEQIVILKSVFSSSVLEYIKTEAFNYFKNHPESNPSIDGSTPNFFRRDNNSEKSAVKRIKQFYASFYWNKDLAGETSLMKAMTVLRNEVAQLPLEYTLNGIEEDGYLTYSNITQYPLGGGKLNKHIDPPNKQFCTILASMSERPTHFTSGGLYAEVGGVKYDLDEYLKIGDVYLMNPQSIHGVDPIDEQYSDIKWESGMGRWVLFPALIEIATIKGVKVKGLEDLENMSSKKDS